MNSLVFDEKTYTYQEEKAGSIHFEYDEVVVRDDRGNRVEVKYWDKVKLEDVQVGDWVVLNTSSRKYNTSRELRKVERVTKTQLTVNGTRFLKSSGHKVGSRNYYFSRTSWVTAYNPKDEIWNWAQFFTNQEAMKVEKELRNRKEQVKTKIFELIKDADMETLETLLEKLA